MTFQTILKLLNSNFLYILLKTQSVAYLHTGLSEWHEPDVTTSPWATKALWKNDKLTFSNSSSAIWLICTAKTSHTRCHVTFLAFDFSIASYMRLLFQVEG